MREVAVDDAGHRADDLLVDELAFGDIESYHAGQIVRKIRRVLRLSEQQAPSLGSCEKSISMFMVTSSPMLGGWP